MQNHETFENNMILFLQKISDLEKTLAPPQLKLLQPILRMLFIVLTKLSGFSLKISQKGKVKFFTSVNKSATQDIFPINWR